MTDEQLDRVYRDYFHREMPATMPPLRKAEVAVVRSEGRSRYVLAASIAAILGLGLWLSANLHDKPSAKNSASKLFHEAEADGKKLFENVEMP